MHYYNIPFTYVGLRTHISYIILYYYSFYVYLLYARSVLLLFGSGEIIYKCYPCFHWTGVSWVSGETARRVCAFTIFNTRIHTQRSRPCNTELMVMVEKVVVVVVVVVVEASVCVWENIQRLITCPRGVRVYNKHHTHTHTRARTRTHILHRKHTHTATRERSRGSMGISDVKNKTRTKKKQGATTHKSVNDYACANTTHIYIYISLYNNSNRLRPTQRNRSTRSVGTSTCLVYSTIIMRLPIL